MADIQDALELAGSRTWGELACAVDKLGWHVDPAGRLAGRHFCVLLGPAPCGSFDILELQLPPALLTCSLREPAISICDGPPMFPFPDVEELLDEFDLWHEASNCPRAGRPFVAAARRVLGAWFGC